MPDTSTPVRPPVGVIIDQLSLIRDERRVLADQDKILSKQYTELEAQLMERFDEEKSPKISGSLASASISEQELGNIEDYDAFEAFIKENDALYLLQRRPAQAALRDMVKSLGAIPGVRMFTKRTINLRKST